MIWDWEVFKLVFNIPFIILLAVAVYLAYLADKIIWGGKNLTHCNRGGVQSTN